MIVIEMERLLVERRLSLNVINGKEIKFECGMM
jgi:hypothetical protein